MPRYSTEGARDYEIKDKTDSKKITDIHMDGQQDDSIESLKKKLAAAESQAIAYRNAFESLCLERDTPGTAFNLAHENRELRADIQEAKNELEEVKDRLEAADKQCDDLQEHVQVI